MSGGTNTGGFTIVETLIVLAVTGMLFVSAALFISGKTAKTEFSQAIQNIQTQIQQTIGEVSSGYYPNLGNMKCAGSGTLLITSGSAGQGTNAGCVFLGKVLQFGVAPPSAGDNQRFIAYTLAGCQYKDCSTSSNPQLSTSLSEAQALVIAPGNGVHTSVPNGSVTSDLENGLSIAWMKYTDSSGVDHDTRGVGFVGSQGSNACSGLCAGAQQVSLLGVDHAPNNLSGPAMVNILDSPSNYIPASGVKICFQSATTNQSGLVTIGGNGRQLSVVLDIKDGLVC